MAQLNDLIVNGYSRFLNSAYGNLNGSATSALCAAYAASTNTAIKVNSATSATSAYDVINKAIKVNSATSATSAYDVINKAINVNSAGSATKAASATSALSAGSAAKAAELTNKAIKVNSAGTADYATSAGSAPFISHNHNYQLSGNGTAVNVSAGVNFKPSGSNVKFYVSGNDIYVSAKDTTGTDTNVTQNSSTENSALPFILKRTTAGNETNTVKYSSAVTFNPSTRGLTIVDINNEERVSITPTQLSCTYSEMSIPRSVYLSDLIGVTSYFSDGSAKSACTATYAVSAGAAPVATHQFSSHSNFSTYFNATSANSALTSKSALSAGSAKNAEWARSADYLDGYAAGAFAFQDGNYSSVGGLTAKSARGAYSASTANYSNSTNTAIKVNSAGSASTAAYASTYPVDYDSCVVTYGDTGCFTKIKNAYTANKKIYMLATVQSYPGNAGNSICKIPLTYSLITGTTYNCFSFNFVNDGGIDYWGSTAYQQGVVYSFTCSSDAAAGWHIKNVKPYASTLANTAGTANYINVNSSNTNTWFNVPLYSAANNQFYYDSNYHIRYNPNVDALSADNILTKAVASNQRAISWQAWKSCMLLYGTNVEHTVDLSNLSEDVVYWLFVGGPKTIYLTHTANNISLHCYDTTYPLNKSSTTNSSFIIRDNACFTTGAGTAHYHGTFSVPIVKASSGDIFVMMSYGDCH